MSDFSLFSSQADAHGEAEDLPVLAGVLAAPGQVEQSERLYRRVVAMAEQQAGPLLAAHAGRDSAWLLPSHDLGRALEIGRCAPVRFRRPGADAELQLLDAGLASVQEGVATGARWATTLLGESRLGRGLDERS